MSSTGAINSPDKQPLRVLVVCLNSREAEIRRIVASHSFKGWEVSGEIGLLTIPDRLRQFETAVSREVEKKTGKSEPVSIIVCDGIGVDPAIGGEGDERKVVKAPGPSVLSQKLRNRLRSHGLDLVSYWTKQLSSGEWDMNRSHIESWISQFERLGQHEWVAEGLLRNLDYWSWLRLTGAFGLTPSYLSNFDCIGFNEKMGSSGHRIRSIVSKLLEQPDLRGIPTASLSQAVSNPGFRRILFIEDAMFTGTEMIQGFSELVNKTESHILRAKTIDLLFPICASLGKHRLDYFLRSNELSSVRIRHSDQGYLNVLTPEGVEAVREGMSWEANRPEILKHVVRPLFAEGFIWKTEDRLGRAISFCRSIGWQLTCPKADSRETAGPCCDHPALGTGGFGLALAYSHSIPRASLPLFWAEGPVEWEGKTLKWIPLFKRPVLRDESFP